MALRLVLQFASVGIRANVWCNGFLVASASGRAPVAVRRRLEPFVVKGANTLEVELVDPPPPDDPKSEPDLEASLHLVGEGVGPQENNRVVAYGFSPNEIEPTDAYQVVLRHVLGVGEIGSARVWDEASRVAPEERARVLSEGMATCKAALETGAGLGPLLEIAARDHAAITDVTPAEAAADLLADLSPLYANGPVAVDIAAPDDLATRSWADDRVLQTFTRSHRPPILVRQGKIEIGLAPAFAVVGGRVRVARWS